MTLSKSTIRKIPNKRKSPTSKSSDRSSPSPSNIGPSFSSSLVPTSSAVQTSNFLSQLESLRSFLNDSGVHFAENDLSSCLRNCGYNVQLAAEQLLTGQYCPPTATTTGTLDKKDNIGVTITPPPSSKPSGITTTSTMDASDNCNGENMEKKATAIKLTKKSDFFNATTKRKTNQTLTQSTPNKRKSPDTITNGTIQAECFKRQSTTSQSNWNANDDKLLLCQRWIVGFSTSRKGKIHYHEPVNVYTTSTNATTGSSSSSNGSITTTTSASYSSSNKKQCNIIRFKGANIEGTFDSNLSNFLTPLLLFISTASSGSNIQQQHNQPLIEIQAQGLMFDDSIRIGTEVPLEVSIFITKPMLFFSLFDADDFTVNHDTSAWYNNGTNKKGSIGSGNSWNGKQVKKLLYRNAAFDLLQWAQYGDVPIFEPTFNGNREDTEKESIDSHLASKSKLKEGDDDESEKNDGAQMKDEENIDEIPSDSLVNQNDEQNVPTWANDILSNDSGQQQQNSSSQMQEENDPSDLNTKGVYLRPYQRQALFWMLNREKNANSTRSKDFQEQLALLSDLASEASDGMSHGGNNKKRTSESDYQVSKMDEIIGVQCEVGPVKVSKEMSSKSLTLDGQEDVLCHPLWNRRYLWQKNESNNSGNHGVYSFFVNELLQIASKSSPSPPRECCGGILADSMGLGKTVMLIALICKDKEILTSSLAGESESIDGNALCTLIVTPLSLLPQWEEEIASKTSLSYKTWYGDSSRKLSQQSDLNGIDILITTYGTIQSEFSNKDKKKNTSSRILDLKFRRIILDEGHLIKNPTTAVSKACCLINAERRWCVTGTPIMNSLHDVFGLLKFLKHEPWSNSSFWKNAISKVMSNDDIGSGNAKESNNKKTNGDVDGMKVALGRVRRVLSPLLLRRTKDSIDDSGNRILSLPPIEKKIVSVEFTEDERIFYNALLDKSQAVFEGFISAGTASKSWLAIFSLLQRLRQSCDHLSLTVKSQVDSEKISNVKLDDEADASGGSTISQLNDNFLNDLLKTFSKHLAHGEQDLSNEQQLAAKNHAKKVALSLTHCMESNDTNLEDECSICLEVPQTHDIAITPCSHVFCTQCLVDAIKVKNSFDIATATCPNCMASIDTSQIKFTGSLANVPKQTDKQIISKRVGVHDDSTCEQKNPEENARKTLMAALNGGCSSKITAIKKELDHIWELDPGSKIIIFSQFLGMLDLIGTEIKQQGISTFKLDGSMSLTERRSTLKEFSSHRDLKMEISAIKEYSIRRGAVLLASMKACGVGLNLVSASTVFIVDPWWNDAMEDQCVNRIHRIGQQASLVRVRKFIVSDSVEEKIVIMQERKKGVASEVLSNQDDVGNGGSNPTLDDFKAIFGR